MLDHVDLRRPRQRTLQCETLPDLRHRLHLRARLELGLGERAIAVRDDGSVQQLDRNPLAAAVPGEHPADFIPLPASVSELPATHDRSGGPRREIASAFVAPGYSASSGGRVMGMQPAPPMVQASASSATSRVVGGIAPIDADAEEPCRTGEKIVPKPGRYAPVS